MSQPHPDVETNGQGKPRKSRWKFFGLAFAILLVLLAIFHRPLFFYGTRYFIIRTAKKQNIDLNYQINGTIFTSLRIRNLEARPTGPGPVEHIAIDQLVLRYSLPGLVRYGFAGFLHTVALENAQIEVNSYEPIDKPKGPRKAFKFPALFPTELRISNLNLLLHQKEGDLEIKGSNLTLLPDQEGKFEISRLAIPQVKRTWENLSASTTYHDRNLYLKDLRFDDQLRIQTLNLDASDLNEAILGFSLDLDLFGGHAEASGNFHDLNASNDLRLDVLVLSIPLERVSEYLKLEPPLGGSVRKLQATFSGPLENPSRWSATASGELAALETAEVRIQNAAVNLQAENGQFQVGAEAALESGDHLTLTAAGALPDKPAKLPMTRVAGKAVLAADNLSKWKLAGGNIRGGSVQFSAPFTLEDGVLFSDLSASIEQLEIAEGAVGNANVQASVRLKLARPEETEPLSGLEAKIKAGASKLRFKEYVTESVALEAKLDGSRLTLKQLEVVQGKNRVTASGTATIPEKGRTIDTAPVDVQFAIEAPRLAGFVSEDASKVLEGALHAGGAVTHRDGKWTGTVNLDARTLEANGLKVRSADADISLEGNVARINGLHIVFDASNHITGSGSFGLAPPFPYEGTLTAKLPNLAMLQPALETPERPVTLAGALDLLWTGKGEVQKVQHAGSIQLSIADARFNEVENINAAINGSYSPEQIELPGVKATSSAGNISADITLRDQRLAIDNLSAAIPQGAEITGFIHLPANLSDPTNPAQLIPRNGPLEAALELKQIQIGPLLKKGDTPPPVTGTVSAKASAAGTIDAPVVKADINAGQLKFEAAPDLEAATLESKVSLAEDTLKVTASFRLPNLQPLTVEASAPLRIPDVLEGGTDFQQIPIQAAVRLPSSSIAWLPRLVPDVRYIEGNAAVNVDLAGTVASPQITGAARLSVPALRFRDENLPPINQFQANLDFEGNTLAISKCSGLLAGGGFSAGGQVVFEPLTNPTIDLRIRTDNALMVRNETVTVRADTDLSIEGPVNGARVVGSVGVTNSRFFREIDILPLELPGRPAPTPPSGEPGFSFPKPPLKDWQFDITIKTLDPFVVRGNLADGSILLDMKLVGTGEQPALLGTVRITDFTASLPFSRLEVANGYAYFTEDQPFVPTLDIQGVSSIRNYRIKAYIYGEATNPQTVFSSEPPLPQEDIISLLATGTTTDELTGSSDALAGRAAVLLVQKLGRMIFKQSKPPKEDSFLDRFDVDAGAVDPRTGRQELQARFRLADQFYLIGDLDVQGDVRGQIKYLLRFK